MRKDILNQIRLIGKEADLLNKSELARRFNCDRRTVDKYLNDTDSESRKPREIKTKVDDFKEVIIDKVDNWGSNSMAVFKFIEKKGYDGGYHTVNNFIKTHRKIEVNKATIRFDTSPGLQAQVDWKESVTMISRQGEIFDINIFLMVFKKIKMFIHISINIFRRLILIKLNLNLRNVVLFIVAR